MNMKKIGIMVLAVSLVLPGYGLARHDAKGNSRDAKAACAMCEKHGAKGMMGNIKHCPMMIAGAQVKVENLADGAVITITSADKDMVKKIQEQSQACLECQTKAGAGKDEMVVCPVMGSTIPKSKAAAVREYKGKTYYLCCQECIAEFDKNPEKYAK